jgi:hypothetical protein
MCKSDSVIHSFNTYIRVFNGTGDLTQDSFNATDSDGFQILRDNIGIFKDSLPLFFHQVKVRVPETFSHYLRIVPHRSGYIQPSNCFDITDRERSTVESPPGAVALEEFARALFLKVDREWQARRAEDTLYYYYIQEEALGRLRIVKHLLMNVEIISLFISVCAFILVLFLCYRYYYRKRQ